MKRLLEQLRAAFLNLAPRERLLVSAVGALLGVAVLWFGLMQPLLAAGDKARLRVEEAEQELSAMTRMRRQYDEVSHRLGTVEERIRNGPSGNLRTTLESMATQAAVKNAPGDD